MPSFIISWFRILFSFKVSFKGCTNYSVVYKGRSGWDRAAAGFQDIFRRRQMPSFILLLDVAVSWILFSVDNSWKRTQYSRLLGLFLSFFFFPKNSLPSAASDTSSDGVSSSTNLGLTNTTHDFQGSSKMSVFTHEISTVHLNGLYGAIGSPNDIWLMVLQHF